MCVVYIDNIAHSTILYIFLRSNQNFVKHNRRLKSTLIPLPYYRFTSVFSGFFFAPLSSICSGLSLSMRQKWMTIISSGSAGNVNGHYSIYLEYIVTANIVEQPDSLS